MAEIIALATALLVLVAKTVEYSGSLETRPRLHKTVVAAVALFFVATVGSLSFAIWDDSHDDSWMNVVDSMDAPVLIYNSEIRIVYANNSALKFYGVDLQTIRGKDPQQLHQWVRPYMTNYGEWSVEQMARNTAARQSTLDSKSRVPMRMSAEHTFGINDWYLSSHNYSYRGERYLITVGSRIAGFP